MNFAAIAQFLLPLILDGIAAAQAIHGDSNDSAKQQHVQQLVRDGVLANNLLDPKVKIDPGVASTFTSTVFSAVDAVKGQVKANQPPSPAVGSAG